MTFFAGASLPGDQRIDQVFPAIFHNLGWSADQAAQDALQLPQASRVCVVLADGLGFENLCQRVGHAGNLRAMGINRAISTIVPSTTAAAITSLGTAQQPGTTAITGYSLRVPDTQRIFSLIKWGDSAVNVAQWQTQPTIFQQLGENASRVVVIQPKKFQGSGLSQAALTGAQEIYADSLDERVDCAARALRNEAEVAYLYWGDIDAAGHKHGWGSDRWIGELEKFDAGIGRLRRSLPENTLLIVTADHGMIDVETRVDIANEPQLRTGVDVVAGESRAVHLYTSEPSAVAQRWRENVGEHAWVATQDELISSGIMGVVGDFTRATMGNVLVFARDAYVFVDSRVQSATAIGLIGVHGSLTRTEMAIPLIMEVI